MPKVSILALKPKNFTEKVLSGVLKNFPHMLFITDRQYNVVYSNRSVPKNSKLYKFLGWSSPLNLSKINDVFHGVSNAEHQVCKSVDLYYKISAAKCHMQRNDFMVVLTVEDITRKIQLKLGLRKQKAMLEAERGAFNKSFAIVEADLNGIITFVNDKYCRVTGYSKKELVGSTTKVLNSGHHSKVFFQNLWSTILSGKVWSGRIRNKNKRNKLYWADIIISPVLRNRKPIKFIGIVVGVK